MPALLFGGLVVLLVDVDLSVDVVVDAALPVLGLGVVVVVVVLVVVVVMLVVVGGAKLVVMLLFDSSSGLFKSIS